MKMSTGFMIVPVLFGILFTACNSPQITDSRESVKTLQDSIQLLQKRLNRFVILSNLFNSKDSLAGDEDGREVSAENANLCINIFPTEMGKHGIKQTAGPVSFIIKKARQITKSEDFYGKGLLDWLVKTVDTYDPVGEGKNIRIKVVFGIYTPTFLANEGVATNLKAKKNDRIGVFLVPYSTATNKPLVTGNGKVYDLGGLDP